ncbi:hypothetical protein [Paenibacillus naphthalenovorans]|uniref:Uncharacterized protein n=1 Tax=Paenibacillus naphthalenovorans TaxID=162209 RepID=A0A0U2VRW9_9BACL|nr:hypothetical protein [Paenibacillus naphthalenovorans]ALS22247.1 hypothetical protein IJ22_18730 [Paenibacillus naphthalenovorans]
MLVKVIKTQTLGFDKGSYIVVEHLDGKIQKINLKKDKKRPNDGNLKNQFYFLQEGSRVYVNEIVATR